MRKDDINKMESIIIIISDTISNRHNLVKFILSSSPSPSHRIKTKQTKNEAILSIRRDDWVKVCTIDAIIYAAIICFLSEIWFAMEKFDESKLVKVIHSYLLLFGGFEFIDLASNQMSSFI